MKSHIMNSVAMDYREDQEVKMEIFLRSQLQLITGAYAPEDLDLQGSIIWGTSECNEISVI